MPAGWTRKTNVTFAFESTVTPLVMVNWDFVSHDDLKTFRICSSRNSPARSYGTIRVCPARASLNGQVLLNNFGADFLQKLFADAEDRLHLQAAARKRKAWCAARIRSASASPVEEIGLFQAQGLGQNIKPVQWRRQAASGDTGFGTVSMMDHAPHPNAAKVYINWLLSKAGQTDWGKVLAQQPPPRRAAG